MLRSTLRNIASCLSFALVSAHPALADVEPIATTTLGKVRGEASDGIYVFRGIPYGADTGGANRFKPVGPPAKWSGVRDALTNAPMCPQVRGAVTPGDLLSVGFREKNEELTAADMSEDCLTLKIVTPALGDGKKRPVMVWLHGGGFVFGSGMTPVVDGSNLVRKGDIVHVAINHRLNIFGHLYLGELLGDGYADSGNAGMLDLVLALQWVRDNIARFGGDPSNVTIYGQSGGGAKVSTLMAMPPAKGLFAKAIIQSGSAYLTLRDKKRATTDARSVLTKLQLKPESARELLSMPFDQVLKAMVTNGGVTPGFMPLVDGRSVPRQPWSPGAPPESANVPLMVGFAETEPTFWFGRDDAIFSEDAAAMRARLQTLLGPKIDAAAIERQYDAMFPGLSSPQHRYFLISSDVDYLTKGYAQAERQAAQESAPVYLFQTTFDTPVADGRWHSPHTIEIPFVHDNLRASPSLLGNDVDQLQPLADLMSSMWLAFARTGDPNVANGPRWRPFDAKSQAVMLFDLETKQQLNPFGKRLELLRSIGRYPPR